MQPSDIDTNMTALEFIEELPEKVPSAALEGIDTRFHFQIEGDGGGDRTVVVQQGKLEVMEGLEGEAKCNVRTSGDTFMKVLKGELQPMMAVLTGKIKISNPAELMKYAKLFGLG